MIDRAPPGRSSLMVVVIRWRNKMAESRMVFVAWRTVPH